MMITYTVIEGIHTDPNKMDTMDPTTKKTYGPYLTESQATEMATSLIQKNVDNFYHRACVQSRESKEDITALFNGA